MIVIRLGSPRLWIGLVGLLLLVVGGTIRFWPEPEIEMEADGIRLPVYDGQGRFGYIDDRGRTAIPFVFEEGDPFEGASARVCDVEGGWGFIDRAGDWLTPRYRSLEAFDATGMARFSVIVDGETIHGFLDRDLGVVVEPMPMKMERDFLSDRARGFEDDPKGELLAVSTGSAPGKGVIDRRGKLVVLQEWDDIMIGSSFLCVRRDDLWGLLDREGELLAAPQWNGIELVADLEVAIIVDTDGKVGMVGSAGELLFPIGKWQYILDFLPGESITTVENWEGEWGLIDSGGKILLEAEWESISRPYEGMVAVGRDGFYGLYDQSRGAGSPRVWEDLEAWPDLSRAKRDGLWGFVDREGTLVIPCEWDEVGSFWPNPRLATVQRNGQWGAINREGQLVVPLRFDTIERDFSHWAEGPDSQPAWPTLLFVKEDKQMGVLDGQGAEVIPVADWDWIELAAQDIPPKTTPSQISGTPLVHFLASRDERKCILARSGATLIPLRWEHIYAWDEVEDGRYWRFYMKDPPDPGAIGRHLGDAIDWLRAKGGMERLVRYMELEVRDDTGRIIWSSRRPPWPQGIGWMIAGGLLVVGSLLRPRTPTPKRPANRA